MFSKICVIIVVGVNAYNVIPFGYGLTRSIARLGIVEERVSDANARMEFQRNILQQELSSLTDVDPYETAFKLNQLLTSLESSYAATARIQSLSLLNFI